MSARTDERGRATIDLAAGHLAVTVFVARDGFAAHEESEWEPDERVLHVQLTPLPEGGSRLAEGVAPGGRLDLDVRGRPAGIDVVEGEHRVLKVDGPDGPDGTEAARTYSLEVDLRVVRVLDGVAVLEHRLRTGDQRPARRRPA
ncbi:MAG: hypothetical protein OXH75_00755 [Acidobacteria bacterium]|nr:hypothetical protein [Acidobacteriota bacterium]